MTSSRLIAVAEAMLSRLNPAVAMGIWVAVAVVVGQSIIAIGLSSM